MGKISFFQGFSIILGKVWSFHGEDDGKIVGLRNWEFLGISGKKDPISAGNSQKNPSHKGMIGIFQWGILGLAQIQRFP